MTSNNLILRTWARELRDAIPGKHNAPARLRMRAQAAAFLAGSVDAGSFSDAIELIMGTIAFTGPARAAIRMAIAEVERRIGGAR